MVQVRADRFGVIEGRAAWHDDEVSGRDQRAEGGWLRLDRWRGVDHQHVDVYGLGIVQERVRVFPFHPVVRDGRQVFRSSARPDGKGGLRIEVSRRDG
jgi:hypothetical protein